ncbi:MAG: hypothetical protein DI631_17200 [Acinetobacter johnsonii]|nr:MAG: hypothetical protein DI631_17200 [Acinetobacter johnsonii]
MTDSNYIQLSYQLIHLTREDLDVISSVNRNLPGLDLNAFSLSLLYLGFIFCTDKQKIFLNAPVQNDIDEMFAQPVRMKIDKNANQKLFNSIKKHPQGKLRRNYITAVLHAGIAVLIELSYLYKLYEVNEDMASLYSVNSFLLRFGLSTCVETYTKFNTAYYVYDIEYLEKKYLDHITIQIPESSKEKSEQSPKKAVTDSIKSKEVPVQKADKVKEAKHPEHKNIQDHSPTVETSQNTETSEINNVNRTGFVGESIF